MMMPQHVSMAVQCSVRYMVGDGSAERAGGGTRYRNQNSCCISWPAEPRCSPHTAAQGAYLLSEPN